MLWTGCEGPPGPRVASKPVRPWKCQGWHILRLGQGFARKGAQNFMEMDIVYDTVNSFYEIFSKIFSIFFSYLDSLHTQKDFIALLGQK